MCAMLSDGMDYKAGERQQSSNLVRQQSSKSAKVNIQIPELQLLNSGVGGTLLHRATVEHPGPSLARPPFHIFIIEVSPAHSFIYLPVVDLFMPRIEWLEQWRERRKTEQRIKENIKAFAKAIHRYGPMDPDTLGAFAPYPELTPQTIEAMAAMGLLQYRSE